MKLCVCYYPEQWPEQLWAEDAARMRSLGLTHVRIGEFAWSRIEPRPQCFDWGWYDRAVEVLHAAGLKIILGTPTATPPKWVVDAHPDILAFDRDGRPRRFGSRRHYCFSSEAYRKEAARIVTAVCERYGRHPAVVAWQTDNEYGCHDTTISYSPAAAAAFRLWLKRRYGTIAAMNESWGAVFWSQEYRSFDEVDPPNLTVTEANPAHRLDYQRFSSDQVVTFNRAQVEIIRRLSPGREVVHNFMGFITDFDHHAVGAGLDASTWDSYPLGFLDQGWDEDATKERFLRQGHPDFAGFHHDLYRGCSSGRLWVMEQQPGPVNWAPNNPAPLAGMVRLWTLEAHAHGAELVSYFRWRQAPFAQEQMHAGLIRPDLQEDVGAREVRAVAAELPRIRELDTRPARVALIFSYEAQWLLNIQPQGAGYDPLRITFEFYGGLRSLGLDVDIVSPHAALDGYALVVAPALPLVPEGLVERLAASGAQVLLGPRSGSKTSNFQIPGELPPGALQPLIPIRIVRLETLRPDVHEPVAEGDGAVTTVLEHVETDLEPVASLSCGLGIWFRHGRVHYLAGWPDEILLGRILRELALTSGLDPVALPDGLRLRRRGDLRFAFNYAPEDVEVPVALLRNCEFVSGGTRLPPAGVAIWREAGSGRSADQIEAE